MSTKVRRVFQPAFHVVEDIRSQIREHVRNEMRDSALALVHGLFTEAPAAVAIAMTSKTGRMSCEPNAPSVASSQIRTHVNT